MGKGGRDKTQEEDEEEQGDDKESCITTDDDSRRRRDRSIGVLTGRPPRALQSRAAFLNGRPSYLLYYWEDADAHQLLQSFLQCLHNNTGVCDALSARRTASGGICFSQRTHQE